MNFLKAVISKLTTVWNFLDGKKTLIGTTLVPAYWALVQNGAIQPNKTVETAIAVLIALGLAHKVAKA